MIIAIEGAVLCLLFTLMVYLMSREPIKTLYNYPPRIQERIRSILRLKEMGMDTIGMMKKFVKTSYY